MPKFRFEAMDSGGHSQEDCMQAASADEAINKLRSEGLFVVKLAEVKSNREEASTSNSSPTALNDLSSSDATLDEDESPPGRWVGVIVTAVGLACGAIGIGGFADTAWFSIGAERADAVVVGPGGRGWVEKLEFTASGHQYTVEARGVFGVHWGQAAGMGARVEVLYPPDHPEAARLADSPQVSRLLLILLVLGLMFTPCGLIVLRRGIRLK